MFFLNTCVIYLKNKTNQTKMKKLLYLLYLFIILVNTSFAELDVKSNIPSWEYNKVLEIFLNSNESESKIFYYLDWLGQIENILEYKAPILIKKDTEINFFATNKDFQDTKIKTSNYKINYNNNINLDLESWIIKIKNNSNEIQNIWYWIIESDNFLYEIKKNTFLEPNTYYNIDYKLNNNTKVNLYSPDKKLLKSNIYKIKPKEIIEEKEDFLAETWSNLEVNSWEILSNNIEENNKNIININSWEILSNSWKISKEETKEFNLSQNIVSSSQNSIKEEKKINIYFIITFLIIIKIISITSYYFYNKKIKINLKK